MRAVQRPDDGAGIDLGYLFLALLQFYSSTAHFDASTHVIDLHAPTSFANKVTLRGGSQPLYANPDDPDASARLCALEPTQRYDAAERCGKWQAVLGSFRALRAKLRDAGAEALLPQDEADAIHVRCLPRHCHALRVHARVCR